jgi:excinuclease ABC subunit A
MGNNNHNALKILGAKENNLKDISLEIPHDQLTVITGLSGSGKSSLAFDTVYAEGQRRYIETFSPYTRQFFDKVKKPLVEKLEHVRPAIAIQQRSRITSARSTVGSLTNINDYLKVIWSALAVPHCPTCQMPLKRWNSTTIAEEIKLLLEQGSSAVLIAAAVHCNKKYIEFEIDRLQTLGYARILHPVTNEVIQLAAITKKDLKQVSSLTVILDRVKAASTPRARLVTSLESAFSLNPTEVILLTQTDNDAPLVSHTYSKHFRCDEHGFTAEPPKTALFSFNHPLGACEACKGFGFTLSIAPNKVVPDVSKTLATHAISCWSGPAAEWEFKSLLTFAKREGIPTNVPWKDLSASQRGLLFTTKEKDFWGVLPWFQWLEKKTYKMHVRVFLSRYREQQVCPSCQGSRLKQQSLAFRVHGKHIGEIWSLPINELLVWTTTVQQEARRNKQLYQALQSPLENLLSRLRYLDDLGLPYLTLDRQAKTLSGGETQRVNLATALGSELTSTQFVLDEPSIGLHARDAARLTAAMKNLTAKGNSLLVVEHDPDVITAADHIIEIGPRAGALGGEVVFDGPASEWAGVTIAGRIVASKQIDPTRMLHIKGAAARNLKSLDIHIPLGVLTCLTGVSGSGKSTLAHEVILNAWKYQCGTIDAPQGFLRSEGFEKLDDLIFIDQSPLAKTPRANIATYTKVWDAIRDLLASTDQAQALGCSKSTFSFNVNAGRCTSCEGAGFIREDMQFLSDVYVPCETCLGKRFQPTVLSISYEGKNVDEFLSMTVDEAVAFFTKHPLRSVLETLTVLQKLGLGASRLGHPLSELSGGEAQRLKLVPYLTEHVTKQCCFIFDEPTTGLHVHDVENFIRLLNELLRRGSTVLCIEHNLSVLQNADWVIDLGPEGGHAGGHLLYQGELSGLLKIKRNETAQHLSQYITATANVVRAPKTKDHPRRSQQNTAIEVLGAREHNLKNISVSIPVDRVVAITGVSGSGKSTLAKDIIYAEGQRRYLDCLSPYARQFIKELKKPDIDAIQNVRPTICVYQHTFQPSALSTVATMSEVYNFLRLLFAKVGTQHCPDHPDQAIAPLAAADIAAKIMHRKDATIRLLSPVIVKKKGSHQAVFTRALESEILEVRVDGVLGKTSHFADGLAKAKVHSIDFVIAKFNPKTINRDALIETIETALTLGGGAVIILADNGKEEILSSKRACPVCETGFLKLDPEDLSFNSKRGRCTSCDGFGHDDSGTVCASCGGSRLQPMGRNVRILGKTIYECTQLNPAALLKELDHVAATLPPSSLTLAGAVLVELRAKLAALCELGLDYIALSRSCRTLSGGELQRLRLATAMGSPLSGVMYIFDEPSAGLHPLDTQLVLSKIKTLNEANNAVILIEHDIESIKAADHIIDIGPLAGIHGGEIVYAGSVSEYTTETTPTGAALTLPIRLNNRPVQKTAQLHLMKGSCHTVQNCSTSLPLHQLVAIGGVSGSGKSTLVHEIINYTLREGKKKKDLLVSDRASLALDTPIDKIIYLDQKPIGSTSRSTPASYLGVWDEIRKVFASTLEARAQGWNQGHFSYNAGKGRCAACKGAGLITLEMNFLADAKVACEDCNGTRYGNDIQIVRYGGRTISEVLALTFEEAKSAFANHKKIHQPLKIACDLGLGYLTLGQSSVTLSGGEAQRLKIVSELSGNPRGHPLYILDEPTLGLHRSDVFRLIESLRALVERGSSVFVIEHDMDVIAASDYFLEMGPGAGAAGGTIIAKGTPAIVAQGSTPWGSLLRRAKTLHSKGDDSFRSQTCSSNT